MWLSWNIHIGLFYSKHCTLSTISYDHNYCTKYNMVLAHKTGKITATLKKNKLHLKKR